MADAKYLVATRHPFTFVKGNIVHLFPFMNEGAPKGRGSILRSAAKFASERWHINFFTIADVFRHLNFDAST